MLTMTIVRSKKVTLCTVFRLYLKTVANLYPIGPHNLYNTDNWL